MMSTCLMQVTFMYLHKLPKQSSNICVYFQVDLISIIKDVLLLNCNV